MSRSEFQANWRGARRYRFDDEVRLKKAAQRNVLKWRRLKHSEPIKLKVLAEDITPRRRGSWMQPMLIGALLAGAVGVGYTADNLSFDSFKAVLYRSGCDVTGDISINTDERIHHLPGRC